MASPNLKRTISQEKIISTAKGFNNLLEEIKNKFVSKEFQEEYSNLCTNIIFQNQDVFNSDFIAKEIENVKQQQNEDRKRKREEYTNKRKIEVEAYLKRSLVERRTVMNDLKLYESFPDFEEEMISNLKTAIDLEKGLSNNKLFNKIYIEQLIRRLKLAFEDVSVFIVFLKTQEIIISKTKLYFAINLAKLAEDFHRITLLAISLRYMKLNFKLIKEILENNRDFWNDIL